MNILVTVSEGKHVWEVELKMPWVPRKGEIIRYTDGDGDCELLVDGIDYTNHIQQGDDVGRAGPWLVFANCTLQENNHFFSYGDE